MADVNSDLVPVWARVVERLVSDPDIGEMDKQWVQRTQPMWMMHDTALLATPNERAKQVLEGRLLPQLTEALSRELSRPVRIAVMVDANAVPTAPVPAEPPAADPYPHSEGGDYGRRPHPGHEGPGPQNHPGHQNHQNHQAYERPYEAEYERDQYGTGGYEERQEPSYGGGHPGPYGGPAQPQPWENHRGYPEQQGGYSDQDQSGPRQAPRPLPGPPATTQGDLFGGAYGPGPGEHPRTGAGRRSPAGRPPGGRPTDKAPAERAPDRQAVPGVPAPPGAPRPAAPARTSRPPG